MPSTVNGIGTHYYGRRDFTSRMGTCQHCGSSGRLESYTTRLYFVIVFIPILPLKRVRIIDRCLSCGRHWIVNPEQFEMARQLAVSGALEKFRDHPSEETALTAHAQLISFHMHEEADKFRESMLDQFPESAEIRTGLATHLEQMGRWHEATPLYERAFELKPEFPPARQGMAFRHMNKVELDKAFELLDFLLKPGAGQSYHLGPLETLAYEYQKRCNYERVLQICDHLLKELPEAAENLHFRKLVTQSERSLRRPNSILPPKSFSFSGLFDSKRGAHEPWVRWTAFGCVAATLFAIGMLALNEYHRTHRTLYLINGFVQPAQISIDGRPSLDVTDRTPIVLSEGRHRIDITGPITKQDEISLQTDYWSRWTKSPIWVFNVGTVAPVIENTLHYSVIPQTPKRRFLSESEFNFVPHADYVFTAPPQSMKLSSHNETITKIAIERAVYPPSTVFAGLQQTKHLDIAMTFAEGHLNRNPNDASLLLLYVDKAESSEKLQQRVVDFLKAGLWRSPISVIWHRSYTGLKPIASNEPQMAEEYDEHLKQDPDNPTLLYLRGRVSANRADQLRYYHLANEKNPQLGWPGYALAADAANRGDWLEAKRFCDQSQNVLRLDPSFKALRHVIQIANGEAAELVREYQQQQSGQDYVNVVGSIFYLVDALASQQKFAEARQAVRQWMSVMYSPSPPAETQAYFDTVLDYVCEDLDGLRRSRNRAASESFSEYLCHSLLALGEPDAAVKLQWAEHMLQESSGMLVVSLAYSLAGNQTEADRWLSQACEQLKKSGSHQQRVALLLESPHAPTDGELDQALSGVRDASTLNAIMARRFPDRKSELNERAKRLNVSRLPPYLLVKMAVEKP